MPSSIEFQLFAPYNRKAALIGSFSNWQDIPMEKDTQGYFHTTVDLDDGQYQYKFRIQPIEDSGQTDKWIDVNDPYITEIDGKTGNGVLHIKEGQRIIDTYVWKHNDQPLPQNHELVIYELLVSDFFYSKDETHKLGQYQDVIEKLDYLKDLGINAIELLPVNEAPGDYNWGYIPSYFFAPQPNYGSTEDLKQLIDECHARGIRVILDQLYNHSSDESPLFHIDRNYWYYSGRHHPDADPGDHWGPEFNYDHYDENLDLSPAWKFMQDVLQFWIQEYRIDGIRYDALKELDNNDLLYWMTAETRRLVGFKPFYNIAERIPEDPALLSPNGPMDGCWHENFYYQVVPHLVGEKFDMGELKKALDPTYQDYPKGLDKAVIYLCNHDQKRLILDLGNHGILDDAAFGRAKLGAVLLMTAVGVPLIWMGEEFGESTDINMNEKSQQLNWSLLENDRNRSLLDFYKGLILLRKNNPALKTDHIDFFHENPDDQTFAYMRWNEEGTRIIVVANFSDQAFFGYEIPDIPENGTWHEWTRDYDIQVENNQLRIDIGGYEAQIFVWG